MEAQDIKEWIGRKRKDDTHPEEWFEILDAINEFMESDNPENEKRMFYPLGYGESVSMICDGLARMECCICAQCRKKGEDIYSDSCGVYDVIPKEIWTVENGNCLSFESK